MRRVNDLGLTSFQLDVLRETDYLLAALLTEFADELDMGGLGAVVLDFGIDEETIARGIVR